MSDAKCMDTRNDGGPIHDLSRDQARLTAQNAQRTAMLAPITHVLGARPNFVKAAPVIRALAALGHRQRVVHTGKHYDERLSEVFFVQLGLPEPDVNLGVGSGSHAQQTAAAMVGLEQDFTEHPPGLVVVYGDVNSTVAAGLVA